MEKVAEMIFANGRHVMYPVLSVDEAEKWYERGIKVFVYGIDTVIYSLSLKKFTEKMRK